MPVNGRLRLLLPGLLLAALAAVAHPRAATALVNSAPDNPFAQTNGRVEAVAYLGNTIYVGGEFTAVGGQARNHLAAIRASDGALLAWNPNANGVVRALAVSPAGTRVYAGGDFSTVGGAARARVAALDPSTGHALSWSPYVNDSVKALATSASGAHVFVGGDFTSVQAAGRRHLASLAATSGAVSGVFKPTLSNGGNNFATVLAMAVAPDGDTLYVSGDFALANGHARRNAAAVSTGVATLRAWSPSGTADAVHGLALSPSGRTVFVGGRGAGGYAQAYGPTAGGTPLWNVHADGNVEAVAASSTTVYVGGHFTSIGGGARGHLAALHPTSGALYGWNPSANGVFGAFAARIRASHLAFGGEFTQVAGQAHQGIVQFSGTP